MKISREEYLQAIKRGMKRHIEECDHMIEAADSEESDYSEESREYWLNEKEKFEERLEDLERENGPIDEDETIEENVEEEITEEEFSEAEEQRAIEEGWDSASQAREWTRSSKQMDKLRRETPKKTKLKVVEDLYAVGLSPEEVYGVADEYDKLIEEAAGREEDEEGKDI